MNYKLLQFALVEDWTVYGIGPRKWAALSTRPPTYSPPEGELPLRRFDWYWEINRRVSNRDTYTVGQTNGVIVEIMHPPFGTLIEAKAFANEVEAMRTKGMSSE